MRRLFAVLVLFSCLALSSCETSGGKAVTKTAANFGHNAAAFANSPTGQALINSLVGAAAQATINVGMQYGMTGKVDPKQIVMAALDGSASGLRSLVPANVSTNTVQTAVTQNAGVSAVSQVVAPIVAQNVQTQIKSGTPPAVALENAAIVLNSVAANPQAVSSEAARAPTPAPTPSVNRG